MSDTNADTVTLTEAAELLGIDNPRSARRALDRAEVRAVSREAGRGGENVYLRAEVEAVRRPGRGNRTVRRNG
jgi:hypothetical protein